MKSTIEKFYRAFNDLDADRMLQCYHEDVVFEDPAFGRLEGKEVFSMWRMLCRSQRGKDFRVHASNIEFDNDQGSALWEAYYTFSKTGRKVHNQVSASFVFKDGKIINHTDTFDLHTWAKQALGIPGLLFGWTEGFRKKFQQKTRTMLQSFEALNS
jgi:ketosteroid isomerase-like protein